ncbi:MAG: DUF4268 domain-containing protein [Dehalococcoidia bacterium]
MNAPDLGRLERVELRSQWADEARHFTPWLAQMDNVNLLGEALGLALEVESVERPVGPFSADIVCRTAQEGHYVLIENQLERTDHTHLGQLLTHAAGLSSDHITVVWIARRFTEEHRSALDWLNNMTPSEVNFFGIEIELWKIGDSPAAPRFSIVSKPNDWSKTIRQSVQGGGHNEVQQLYLEYWAAFREWAEQKSLPLALGKPSTDGSIGAGTLRSGIWENAVASKDKAEIRVQIWTHTEQFFREWEQNKDVIDAALPLPELAHITQGQGIQSPLAPRCRR